jgi:predicted Fe-S protein YdhL (DUF1289 family)
VITPCVSQCRLVNERCVSCKRTRQEIAQWSRMNEDDRKKIIKQLEER